MDYARGGQCGTGTKGCGHEGLRSQKLPLGLAIARQRPHLRNPTFQFDRL